MNLYSYIITVHMNCQYYVMKKICKIAKKDDSLFKKVIFLQITISNLSVFYGRTCNCLN